jgi:hypothetical protein
MLDNSVQKALMDERDNFNPEPFVNGGSFEG